MMTTPFLSMILMLCALWGVVGKTTYADQNGMAAQKHFDMPEAKNYLVNETKRPELCATVPEIPDTAVDKDNGELTDKKLIDQKIDWEHTV
jgi:hypothetical protein